MAWKAATVLHGRAHFGVLREGQGGQVAAGLTLTAPPADPSVLEVMHGTPVTVFVPVARTDLARDLSAAGHEIGLMGVSSRTLEADRGRLEAASGRSVRWLRLHRTDPYTLHRARRAGLLPVWSGPEGDPEALLRLAEPGGLLSLDGLKADQVTGLLAELRARGYQPGPIGALKGLRTETVRGLLQRLYRRFIDARFDRQHGAVPLTQRPRGLFRLSRRDYIGPPIHLPGGGQYLSGMPAAELHIYSKRLVALAELSALTGLRGVQHSLHDVAQAMQEREEFRDAQFIYALTIFAGVLGPMGFQSEPLPDRRQARVMAVFFNLLRVLYGAKNTDSQVLLPAVIWMSRETLIRRYGQKPGAGRR